jgi:hypothetical protein
MKGSKVFVFDNYNPDGIGPVNEFMTDIAGKFVVLPQVDPSPEGGTVQLALYPNTAFPGPASIQIRTQNCVPDDRIQANIKYATTLHDNWIRECQPHDLTAVMVSGGPSFVDHLDELKACRRRKSNRIVCVKHSHDVLIENKIIPWACVLLDPRNHVQDFIESPHPDVTYFTASMCHPTTLDRLLDRSARIWGYHALVGAGEQSALDATDILVAGGSTSAVRGIFLLHALGFRKFRMFGYDSCYRGEVDREETDAKGRQKYFDVEVSGRKFVSDPELIAQAQDFDKMLGVMKHLDLDIVGDGMIPHIWSLKRRILPTMEEVLNG